MLLGPRAWKLHAGVLTGVLALLLGAITRGAPIFILAFAFGFLPLALTYAVASTALVAAFGRRWWGVLLAHGLALATGAGVALFFVK